MFRRWSKCEQLDEVGLYDRCALYFCFSHLNLLLVGTWISHGIQIESFLVGHELKITYCDAV
jgi:hypothetical protein